MTKILLVEDDRDIIKNLTSFLSSEGFSVDSVTGQRDAVLKMGEGVYDIVLLDVSLSDGNGFSTCRAIKSIADIPVIFLTASDDEFSVVTGFDVGGDDYVSKPFRPRELVSRIKNALRRAGKNGGTMEYMGITVDPASGTATKNGNDLFLSALEYRLLLVFFNNRGAVISRSRLLQEIWDIAGDFVNDNTLTVYIKRLRDKIEEDPQNPQIIKTLRGLGYKMGD